MEAVAIARLNSKILHIIISHLSDTIGWRTTTSSADCWSLTQRTQSSSTLPLATPLWLNNSPQFSLCSRYFHIGCLPFSFQTECYCSTILLFVWQPIVHICRLEGTVQCSWYRRKCHNITPGHNNPSLQWWKQEDSLKIGQTAWEISTTGEAGKVKLEFEIPTFWVFTGTTVSNCGTPCIVTLRGWSRLLTPQNRWERENFIIN